MSNLRIMEPREPYNTKEDLLELAEEYKELKQNEERDIWKRARLAHEAAEKFDLKQFAKLAEENYDVLKNLSGIAGKYTEEDQKKYGITLLFKHFIVAAKADNRLEWLKKAQDNAWSAERLRREMNPPKSVEKKEPVPVKEEPKGTIRFEPRIDPYVPPKELVLPNDAFKPWVQMFNQLYTDGALTGLDIAQAIVFAFGQQDEYRLEWEEGFGYRMISLKPEISE